MIRSARRSAKRCAIRLRPLRRDESAVAMVEFAFSAPLVLGMGLLGTETAYFTITHMQVSQIAMQVADNASRVGEQDVLVARKIYEDDVNGTFIGAEKLGGNYDIFGQGRIVLSSLQMNADGGQWIAWQRCRGAKAFVSKYGTEGTGASGTGFLGMGSPRIRASSGTAVMFVEVSYTYEPVTPFEFFGDTEIEYSAAFNVRDARDLTQIYQTNPAAPVASCGTYSADRPI
ncbi:TadE/TadG family type IV pilus assembly protein [Qipengyuania sp. ASV99]|uniref:TadE/TadG family type IV pilus assembly protein n=1 Tax=Qipengyuania sp. ASV99 TaxID=3399681 RepID=UPI003A4C7EC5